VFGGVAPVDWARAAAPLESWGYLRPEDLTPELHGMLLVCADEQYLIESEEEERRERARKAVGR
jgi:hypothetical protein